MDYVFPPPINSLIRDAVPKDRFAIGYLDYGPPSTDLHPIRIEHSERIADPPVLQFRHKYGKEAVVFSKWLRDSDIFPQLVAKHEKMTWTFEANLRDISGDPITDEIRAHVNPAGLEVMMRDHNAALVDLAKHFKEFIPMMDRSTTLLAELVLIRAAKGT